MEETGKNLENTGRNWKKWKKLEETPDTVQNTVIVNIHEKQ